MRLNLSLALAIVAVLASCGADGMPEPPKSDPAPQPGITLSGSAEIGVAKR